MQTKVQRKDGKGLGRSRRSGGDSSMGGFPRHLYPRAMADENLSGDFLHTFSSSLVLYNSQINLLTPRDGLRPLLLGIVLSNGTRRIE